MTQVPGEQATDGSAPQKIAYMLQQTEPAVGYDDLYVEQLEGLIWRRKWRTAAWTSMLAGLMVGKSLLRDLLSAEPVGRLVINRERVTAAEPGSRYDVLPRGGDRPRVPKRSQEVTLIGEVQNATSSLFDPALTWEDCLHLTVGTTIGADDKSIHVVRASGSVDARSGSRWFRSSTGAEPRDTIVVSLDAERMRL